MRNKTLASLLILCGSTAAFAAIPQGEGPAFQDVPQNNSVAPPVDPAPETTSNTIAPPTEAPATPDTGDDQPPKPEPQR